ncbi:hypothetical protein OC845_003135 [Tilletia horrida]|nr:hypothetical protein OC845_003135 [Tilletia horrida]
MQCFLTALLAVLHVASLGQAASLGQRAASPGAGADSCAASKSNPTVFKGIFTIGYGQGGPTGPVPAYGYPTRASATADNYVWRNSLSSVFPDGYHYEGVAAYPCDSVASKVNVTLQGSDAYSIPTNKLNKIETGILRSTTNHSLCLKAPKGTSSSPGDSYYPAFGPCPTTSAALTGNSGQFIWSWAYNSTLQSKNVSNTPVRPKGPVYVTFTGPKIKQSQFAFGSFGYYSGSFNEGAASIVGNNIYVQTAYLQLVGAYNGNINKTQQSVYNNTNIIFP